jgi:hypothetical protein
MIVLLFATVVAIPRSSIMRQLIAILGRARPLK